MEVEADPNLLVVNLDCVPSETRQFGKSSCIYTTMPSNNCGHDVLQLATPVQCIGDLNQPLSRIQHQHLTQLQSIQYPQVQVSYDNASLQQPSNGLLTGGAPVFQATPPSTALHHYHPPPPAPPPVTPTQTYHGSYLTPLSVAPSPALHDFRPLIPPPTQQNSHECLSVQPADTSLISLATSAASSTLTESKTKDVMEESEPPPADDYLYYREIERLLTAGEIPINASLIYIKRLKKRAQNYLMIDNVLHHNPKEPRRVVMTKEEQTTLLESYHVSASTGVHNGIKKMFAELRAGYFWRGMYVCVATYVRKCTSCRDSVHCPIPSIMSNHNQQDVLPCATSCNSIGVQTVSRIWADVEIQVCGPYNTTNNRNSYIATIVDPESKFLLAAALPSSGLATRLTQFVLTSLFSYGFARAHLVITSELYGAVHDEFLRCTKDLRDCHGLLRRRETPSCEWVISLLKILVEKKPNKWDKELDKFLYQFRSGEFKQFMSMYGIVKDYVDAVCPFYSMFQRSSCPIASGQQEDKENSLPKISNSKSRCNRKKQSSKTLQSKRLNSKNVTDKQSESNGEITIEDYTIKEGNNNKGSLRIDQRENQVGNRPEENNTEPLLVAVSSIKAFLAETRVMRQRRGSYNKYPDELRDRMANYALKHGIQEATKHFSEMLGTQVNDSTIRNLMKSRTRFGIDLREEIAKYASERGVSEAYKHYSSSLNIPISHYLIRRFKSLYGPKRGQCKKAKNRLKRDVEGLTTKVKDDIGRYTNEHSVEESIEHFKNLLGISLLESAVKKLHEDYLQKQGTAVHYLQKQKQDFAKPEAVPEYTEQNNICYSQVSNNLESQNAYLPNVQMYQPQFVPGPNPGRPPENVENEAGNSIISQGQHFLLVSQENHPNYESVVQNKINDKNNWVNDGNSNSDYQQYPQGSNQIFVEMLPEKNNPSVQTSEQVSIPAAQVHSEKSKKKIVSIKKRGKYSTFSPELRAEIGKYAVEHGCLKASNHFSSILGQDLSESTARGIKEKYLIKLKYSEVTSLGYSPRGRAPRLGRYDEMVQDCLKELIKSGEKATSFLAIITARKVLTKYEPNLLKENGGNIVLNISWAKSFLKRLGLRNNS